MATVDLQAAVRTLQRHGLLVLRHARWFPNSRQAAVISN
jgi:hypothetical protein